VLSKSESIALSLEESVADYLLRLLVSADAFDKTFFEFFSADLSLIKQGDKSYEQFLEICL
jgi:hypothetical protein